MVDAVKLLEVVELVDGDGCSGDGGSDGVGFG